MSKLVVFPTDTLERYVTKGEIKQGYFNPGDVFTEVHIMNFSSHSFTEQEISFLSGLVGRAKLIVHPVGDYTFKRSIIAHLSLRKEILSQVRRIEPDVIRAYGAVFEGYYAEYCARKLDVPLVLSLHTNYDTEHRVLARRNGDWTKWVFYQLWKRYAETRIVRSADHLIAFYKWPEKYARDRGVPPERITQIYNRVYARDFFPDPFSRRERFTAITVGNLNYFKSPKVLIEAMRDVDGTLLMIGDGPEREEITELIEKTGVGDRLEWIRSVPNAELVRRYNQAHVYVSPMAYGGICIPHLEAMACALPLVVNKAVFEERPELVADIALVVERTPSGFAEALNTLKDDADLRERMGRQSLALFKKVEGRRMESREAGVYSAFLAKGRRRANL